MGHHAYPERLSRVYSVRLPPDLDDRVAALARAERRPKAETIRLLVERGLPPTAQAVRS